MATTLHGIGGHGSLWTKLPKLTADFIGHDETGKIWDQASGLSNSFLLLAFQKLHPFLKNSYIF
jgi:hypothetical protein